MLCAIHQPNLFPRLSTLAKIYTADCLIVLDDVQFTRRDYQHRCRLAHLDNPAVTQWLSLSVHLPQGRSTPIASATIIDRAQCRRRLTGMLHQYYRRSPHWQPFADTVLDEVLTALDTARLADTAEASMLRLLHLLGWTGTTRRSSTLDVSHERSQRLADLTHHIGAATYLSGTGGSRYLDPKPFQTRKLTVLHLRPATADQHPLWTTATRISALWPIMRYGPDQLRRQLDQYAAHVRTLDRSATRHVR